MRISLRLKLGLISLLLLAIPYSGMRLSAIVQANLLQSRKDALMFSARAVAEALSGREGLFDQERFRSLNQSKDLYLYQLTNPIRINGKLDDWQPQIQHTRHFGKEHILKSPENYLPEGSGFDHMVGKRGDYLYAVFLVSDESLVFKRKNSLALEGADHLKIALEDRLGNYNRYIVTADSPGWVNSYLISRDFESILPVKPERRIQGVLEKTLDGYIMEIRIPNEMVGDRLAFAIADVDDPGVRNIETVIGTSSVDGPDHLGWLLEPSSNIEGILESLNRQQSKIQVVDSNQHIRASFGSLTKKEEENLEDNGLLSHINLFLAPLYRLFTEPFATDFNDPKSQPSTLNIEGIRGALMGNSTISSYRIAEGQVEVMAAMVPLHEKGEVVGAVVVEQTTNSILALKNRVIRESIGLTLLVLFFGGFGLLIYSFRISSRIRQLRDQASQAIGDNGQILNIAAPAQAHDEIGDLSRTLHTVLSQLKAQGQYREKMADNLEHEMRTPLASVSASLKNLANELADHPDHLIDYVNWALGDIKRMEDLLTSMRDATSLANALQQDSKEHFNLSEALAMWLEHSWTKTFTETDFIYKRSSENIEIQGDPDRIRQMIDKLIENSVAFHTSGTAIELELTTRGNAHHVTVTNQGPHIPENMLEEIFNSMVTLGQRSGEKPHLGLGLYIVRTIAQHHSGSVTAKNLDGDYTGVRFTIKLPRLNLRTA